MTRRHRILLGTSFFVGFCVACFLAWLSGVDFDKRGHDLAAALSIAFLVGGLSSKAIEGFAGNLDRNAKYPLGDGEIGLIALSAGLRYGGSNVDECLQHAQRLRKFAREVERWHGIGADEAPGERS